MSPRLGGGRTDCQGKLDERVYLTDNVNERSYRGLSVLVIVRCVHVVVGDVARQEVEERREEAWLLVLLLLANSAALASPQTNSSSRIAPE